MKCYVHQDVDAVAVCKVCGKGACNDCTIILSGDSYCKTCLETGRVKTLGVQTRLPLPTGTPSRAHFIIGSVGAVIAGVTAVIHMILGFLMGHGWLFWPNGSRGVWILIPGVPLAVGLILAGIGYLGVRRNYGRGIGVAGLALSIVCAASLLSTMAVGLAFGDSTYFRYGILPVSFAAVNGIIFGTTQILYGVAHIVTRQFTGNSSFALATGIVLIISGALTASVLLSFAGIPLFLAAEIMAAILFLTSRLPEPITPQETLEK